MRTPDPFRRAAVLALAWWLVGLGIDTNADSSKVRGPARRPAVVAEGWRAQASCPDQPARLGQPTLTMSHAAPLASGAP
jgi:hypothetical protein